MRQPLSVQNKIAVLATFSFGKERQFLPQWLTTASNLFRPLLRTQFAVFTDEPEDYWCQQFDIIITKEPFPERAQTYSQLTSAMGRKLAHADYVYLSDCRTMFVRMVQTEILVPLICTVNPRWFEGGQRERYLEAMHYQKNSEWQRLPDDYCVLLEDATPNTKIVRV